MAHLEGCKHAVEVTVPVDDVARESDRAVDEIRKKLKMPGFRPGKVPAELVRKRFAEDIRQQVMENLVPRFLKQAVEKEDLSIVGRPEVTEVKWNEGEPLRFRAEFEVSPQIELGEYRGVSVTYHEPEVTAEDVAARLEELRDRKAEYINVDPRPLEDGDYAVVSLNSLSGVEGKPIQQKELVLHIGDPDTMPAFTENLRGASPDDQLDFDVQYPEEYDEQRLAGRTVRFRARVLGIRRKELPELNDEFAVDLGDYQNLEELQESVRRTLFAEREYVAQQIAKNQIVEKLVEAHDFPVPEAYVDSQIYNSVTQALAGRGVDASKVKIDWAKAKESQRDQAIKDIRGSLLLEKISDREAIYATNDEMDRELGRISKQQREPVAAVRMRLEKDGSLGRIANRIRTDKTLNFLFEHARKQAE